MFKCNKDREQLVGFFPVDKKETFDAGTIVCEKINIIPYDNLPLLRKMIDYKIQQIGAFDLGNHILIIGMILIAIFISLNVG